MREPTPIPPRRSATVDAHRADHNSGLHPEDAPYITAQKKRYANPLDLADQLDFQDEPTRSPTSARRWIDTKGNQVIQRGNQRFVIHDEPPPRRRRRIHGAAILGIGMTLMVLMFIAWTLISNWWTNHQLDATYGFPRTYQTDQVVGIGDSTDHPSHFIFLNLSGKVEIIFLPGGDASRAKIYQGPQLYTDNAASVPVTGKFKGVGNGKVDMIVHIGDDTAVFVPPGSAAGYGITHVSAHTVIRGKAGNIPSLDIDRVEGSSIYIRNLKAFTGGQDAYSVKFVTPQDRQTAIDNARASLTPQESKIHEFLAYPCKKTAREKNAVLTLSWTCQYVTYSIPSYMHVTAVRLIGKVILVDVVFVERPRRIWVK